MFEKFVPASTKPFPLGLIFGTHFSVVVSRKSCFDGFERHTELPCLHLSVAPDDEKMTWEFWFSQQRGVGLVEDVVEERMHEIIRHFFGEALTVQHAGWRIERNSPNAARRQTVHFHLEVGHKDLFGEEGYVRQCVQSALKPDIIVADAKREIDAATVEKVVQAIVANQPTFFRNVTIGFNTESILYRSFIELVTETANEQGKR